MKKKERLSTFALRCLLCAARPQAHVASLPVMASTAYPLATPCAASVPRAHASWSPWVDEEESGDALAHERAVRPLSLTHTHSLSPFPSSHSYDDNGG